MASEQLNNNTQPVPLQATNSQRLKISDLSVSASKNGRSQLGADFKPSRFSVICGRGRDSYDHAGNHNFRELATFFVARYSRAGSKGDRSEIVSEMVGMIYQANGTFCQFEKGVWFKVADHYAREKAAALLRDMVHTQQRTLFKAKKVKKTKAKPARPSIQEKDKARIQGNSQKLVDGTAEHSDYSTITQAHYGQQLSDGWHSDDSSVSCCDLRKGSHNVSNRRKRCDPLRFKDNSLECEDDFFDIFRMDSSSHN
jgi:hypothetical protein